LLSFVFSAGLDDRLKLRGAFINVLLGVFCTVPYTNYNCPIKNREKTAITSKTHTTLPCGGRGGGAELCLWLKIGLYDMNMIGFRTEWQGGWGGGGFNRSV
jgi:hypothetical protein